VFIAAIVLAALGLSLVSVLARAGSRHDADRTAAAEIAPNAYAQTWPKTYDVTTCAEFLGAMSDQQRLAAGADLLVAERLKGDSVDMPDHSMITAFVSTLRTACPAAPEQSLAAAGANLYRADRDRYRR
jgi:hypothetical protein